MACTLSNKCAKIFLNGQFYFNLSSKMWSHVFLEHSVVCIGKQHSIYEVFTAKIGKVAGEGKIVRSGSEVITGGFD